MNGLFYNKEDAEKVAEEMITEWRTLPYFQIEESPRQGDTWIIDKDYNWLALEEIEIK